MLISCPLLCLLWEKSLWKGEVLLPQYALIKLLLSRGKGGGKKVSVSIAWKGRGEKVSVSIAWNKPYLQKQFLPPLCTGMGFLRATAPLLYCVASTLLIGPQIKEKEEGIKVRVLFILEEGFIPCAILPLQFGFRSKQSREFTCIVSGAGPVSFVAVEIISLGSSRQAGERGAKHG